MRIHMHMTLLATLFLFAPTLCATPLVQCWEPGGTVASTIYGSGFSNSTDIHKNTAVSGQTSGDSFLGWPGGVVYVYERVAGTWGEVATVVADEPQLGDYFGASISLHEDTLMVGATGDEHTPGVQGGLNGQGSAYIFERDFGGTNSWGERIKLTASTPGNRDDFGCSVSVWGDTAVVGAQYDDDLGIQSGSAWVFERNLGGVNSWGMAGKLTASDGGQSGLFGSAASICQDTIVVGARAGNGTGAAYVFLRDQGGAGAWGEVKKITPSTGFPNGLFGWALELYEDTLLVGAFGESQFGLSSGAAYVFYRDHGGVGNWGEVAELAPPAGTDNFGSSVDLHGDTAVVECWGKTLYVSSVFGRDAGGADGWGLLKTLSGTSDRKSPSIDGTTIVAGEYVPVSPSAFHFYEQGSPCPSTGNPSPYCTAGTSASGCHATISALGFPSATLPSGFEVKVVQAEGAKDGLFFFGTSGRQVKPWGNSSSFQCVVPPVKRGPLMVGLGTSLTCDGTFSQDLNALWCPSCPKPLHNPGAGAVVQAQLWYRDPWNTSNQTTSLSDAIEFTVAP